MTEKSLSAKIREAVSHTLIYGMGSVLQTALGFILIPLYTRYYSPNIYGTLALLQLCATIAGSVLFLGASSALARSYFDYPEGPERKKTATTSLVICLSGAVAQIILAFVLRFQLSTWLFQNEKYALHVFLILTSSAIAFINALFYIILRFQRKSKHVISLNLLSLFLSVSLITTFLTKLKMGVMAPILGDLINQIILFFCLFLFSRTSFGWHLSKHELKVQLQFGLPTIFIGLGYYLMTSIDKLFINKYGTLGDVGIYTLGYKLGTMIHILFILPFSQIYAPMRMEYRHDSNARELYRLILTYYFVIGTFITVAISLFSHELLKLISGQKDYIVAYKIIPIVMLAHLIYGVINIIDNGIYFSRKIYYHAIIFWVSVVFNASLNYLLIPRFGYMAAAYNILLTFAVTIALVYFISNRLFKIEIESIRLVKVLAAGLFIIIVNSLLFFHSFLIALAMKSAFVALFLLFLYVSVLNGREKGKIAGIVKRLAPSALKG